jgi:hypothetical protein
VPGPGTADRVELDPQPSRVEEIENAFPPSFHQTRSRAQEIAGRTRNRRAASAATFVQPGR